MLLPRSTSLIQSRLLLVTQPPRLSTACLATGFYKLPTLGSSPFAKNWAVPQRRWLANGSATSGVEEDKQIRISYLPQWAKEEFQPPLSIKLLGMVLLTPLVAGAVSVHLLGGTGDEEDDTGVKDESASREVLSWTLHYAGALLSFAAALHWGMQLAEFGVPLRSDFMQLYYLSRFSAPAVFVFFGWLGSVLSAQIPREATLWVLGGYVGLLSCDLMARGFEVAPLWWARWRAGFGIISIVSLVLLLVSERNLYLGHKPMIRM